MNGESGYMKNIMFLANSYGSYMGGIYYIKNMVYALANCENSATRFRIYILTAEDCAEEFKHLLSKENVFLIHYSNKGFVRIVRKLRNIFYKRVCHKTINEYLDSKIVKGYAIDVIYPLYQDVRFQEKGILWIPDFQHFHYPQFFGDKVACESIEADERKLVQIANTIILSSQDCYKDFMKYYGDLRKNVAVVPFVSELEVEEDNISILTKYNLPSKFFIVSNQFYVHKNHITVFRAIAELVKRNRNDIKVIFTGQLEDYRNPQYIAELKSIINEHGIEQNIRILGLIPRKEQLSLIRKSIAVIQPSLFEGWSTIVEDAKSMHKNIILSDIDVHLEQKVENGIYFQKENYMELAEIMEKVWDGVISFPDSNYNYKEKAKEYGNIFANVLERYIYKDE